MIEIPQVKDDLYTEKMKQETILEEHEPTMRTAERVTDRQGEEKANKKLDMKKNKTQHALSRSVDPALSKHV